MKNFLVKLNLARRLYFMYGMNGVRRKIYEKFRKLKEVEVFTKKYIVDAHYFNSAVFKRLIDGVAYVYGMAVEGDVAEFGTMTGRSAVAIATAVNSYNNLHNNNPPFHSRGLKKAWFFDSFEGLPEARFDVDRHSHHVATGIWGKGTCRGLSELKFTQEISKRLSKDSFVVKKGWFKDSVLKIPPQQKFALIHIDGDLYESAIDVLDYFFANKMVSKGAILFFDDWNCNAADPTLGERKAWNEVVERYNIRFSDESSYGIAQHSFIVHGYQ